MISVLHQTKWMRIWDNGGGGAFFYQAPFVNLMLTQVLTTEEWERHAHLSECRWALPHPQCLRSRQVSLLNTCPVQLCPLKFRSAFPLVIPSLHAKFTLRAKDTSLFLFYSPSLAVLNVFSHSFHLLFIQPLFLKHLLCVRDCLTLRIQRWTELSKPQTAYVWGGTCTLRAILP